MIKIKVWGLRFRVAIYHKDDNLVQRFEYADNRMPISMTQNNKKYYLHYNQVGTLKAVSDNSLKILKEINYDTGRPPPLDLFAPFIGETINEINSQQ